MRSTCTHDDPTLLDSDGMTLSSCGTSAPHSTSAPYLPPPSLPRCRSAHYPPQAPVSLPCKIGHRLLPTLSMLLAPSPHFFARVAGTPQGTAWTPRTHPRCGSRSAARVRPVRKAHVGPRAGGMGCAACTHAGWAADGFDILLLHAVLCEQASSSSGATRGSRWLVPSCAIGCQSIRNRRMSLARA